MKIISKIKKLFTKKKSPEALKMWDNLKDTYTGNPEFHPSLALNAEYALSLSDEGRERYLHELMRRRQEAHDKDL